MGHHLWEIGMGQQTTMYLTVSHIEMGCYKDIFSFVT